MLEADANLYLPISAQTLQAIVAEGKHNDALNANHLSNLTTHEIACFFFLMHLPQLKPNDANALEQLLFECIKACQMQRTQTQGVGQADSGSEEFVTFCVSQLDGSTIRSSYELLSDYQVVPLDEHTLANKDYLDQQGLWDYEFCQQHRHRLQKDLIEVNVHSDVLNLSAEQSRIYRELMAGEDEHIHIQGYAGTGKTTLVKSLISIFEKTSAKLLVLAERKTQLDVFLPMTSHSDRVDVLTYTELAKLIISRNTTERGEETILRKGITRATMPDSQIIQHLGLIGSRKVNVNQLVKAVRATVFAYCQSDANDISIKHIPKHYKAIFDAPTQGAVTQYANRLWQSMLSPPTVDFTPQIRAYHIIKWAALNCFTIPDEYTHILIDECHDLSAPVNQILLNSSQARISLGDDYQNLNGYLMKPQGVVRQREMYHSLRSSHQIESLINPIISAHPSRVNATFFGNRMNRLEMTYYEKAAVPKDPCLIIARDLWGLFEWSQRLASGQMPINLLSNLSDLDIFVQDCIELYSTGTRARHGQLFRFTSWQQVYRHYQDNPAFRRVCRMLEKNYSQQDWQQTRQYISGSSATLYTLALVENVRNLEFDSVMLTPQVVALPDAQTPVDSTKATNKVATGAAFYAALYVAVTRARKRLIAPESLRNHIEEIA